MPSSDKDKENEKKLWSLIIEKLNGSIPGGAPNNTIMMPQAYECMFDSTDVAKSNEQLFYLGNTIPDWSLTWTGNNSVLFDFYKSFISQVHPKPQEGITEGQVNSAGTMKKEILDIEDGYITTLFNKYGTMNCSGKFENGDCNGTWLGDGDNPKTGFKAYKSTDEYKAELKKMRSLDENKVQGLKSQLETLEQKIYGPNYQEIQEALDDVKKADPETVESSPDYQMPVKEEDDDSKPVKGNKKRAVKYASSSRDSADDNLVSYKPRFVLTNSSYKDFDSWLADAKKGSGTQVTFEVSSKEAQEKSSSYQFGANLAFPVEDIIMVGASASGSGSESYASKYEFKMVITYNSVLRIDISPSDMWFKGAILEGYRDFVFEDSSNFHNKQLWGPTGIFNLQITGMLIAYQPSVEFTSDQWNDFKSESKWSEKSDVSILGIIPIASESASGGNKKHTVEEKANGATITDNTGVPKIIALYVKTINNTNK